MKKKQTPTSTGFNKKQTPASTTKTEKKQTPISTGFDKKPIPTSAAKTDKKQTPGSANIDKLGTLRSQMKDMSQDYQDMIKAREEAKRQLESRFTDVYSQIEENKQFTVAEGNHVMETLKSFQDSFENKLEIMSKSIDSELMVETKATDEQLGAISKKLDTLEKTLTDEKQERFRLTEENLCPIRKDIDRISIRSTLIPNFLLEMKEGFEKEKSERTAKEAQMLTKLAEEAANILKLIEKHKQERVGRTTEVKEDFKEETKLQTNYIKQFEEQANGKFAKLKTRLDDEMGSRFSHQDQVIDNLQKVIQQFQGTLKVFGKNV